VKGQTGIGALALRLNHILVEHIRALLPSLRAHLEEAAERRSKELKVYGVMPPGSTSAARCPSIPARGSLKSKSRRCLLALRAHCSGAQGVRHLAAGSTSAPGSSIPLNFLADAASALGHPG